MSTYESLDNATVTNNVTNVVNVTNVTLASTKMSQQLVGQEGTMFFNMYYSPSRFASECILAAASIICNVTALYLCRGHYYQHHAYHSFFKNMAIANALSSLTSWVSNNTMFLFSSQLAAMQEMCHMLVLLLTLNVSSMAFGIASGLTIVGFGVIHYTAICWPLSYDQILTKKRVHVAIAAIWIFSFVLSLWPLIGYAILLGRHRVCLPGNVEYLTTVSATISMVLLCLCYTSLATLCLRIYYEICVLQHRLEMSFWCDDLQFEKKAWRTVVMLLSTMTIFVLPYSIMYIVSLNTGHNSAINQNPVVLFYMMLLPYIKYATDPVIYGKRMLGLQERLCQRISQYCCPRIKSRSQTSSTVDKGTKRAHLYQGVQTVL